MYTMYTFTRVHLESKTDERTCVGLGPWRQRLPVPRFFRMHDWATFRPQDVRGMCCRRIDMMGYFWVIFCRHLGGNLLV